MKIAVLCGGTSAERDVSFASSIAIAKAIEANSHDVTLIDCAFGNKIIDHNSQNFSGVKLTPPNFGEQKQTLDQNLLKTVNFLLTEKFDLVFNGLHGGYGENGQLSALLEIAGITYTGSDSVASAVGMDKHYSKLIFQANNVAVADWQMVQSVSDTKNIDVVKLGLPLIVKPNAEGSTVGLTIVKDLKKLPEAIETALQFDKKVMLETFIPGRELTVAIVNDIALPIIEIRPKSGFYDYESKYQSGMTEYIVPAQLPNNLTLQIQESALRAHKAIGCKVYSRVDYRLTDKNEFYCLEINTLPGMTATSLVPKAAKAAGFSFEKLIETIIVGSKN